MRAYERATRNDVGCRCMADGCTEPATIEVEGGDMSGEAYCELHAADEGINLASVDEVAA